MFYIVGCIHLSIFHPHTTVPNLSLVKKQQPGSARQLLGPQKPVILRMTRLWSSQSWWGTFKSQGYKDMLDIPPPSPYQKSIKKHQMFFMHKLRQQTNRHSIQYIYIFSQITIIQNDSDFPATIRSTKHPNISNII